MAFFETAAVGNAHQIEKPVLSQFPREGGAGEPEHS
jgi:hypothetical protein